MPDFIIRYIPELTFISFVCNFGGLLGMWLGVSFLSIINYFKIVLVKFLKDHTNQTNIQLNFSNNTHGDKLFVKRIGVVNIK